MQREFHHPGDANGKKVRYAVVIAAPEPWNTAIALFMCQPAFKEI